MELRKIPLINCTNFNHIKLFIKTLTNHVIEIYAHSLDLIEDLKLKIHDAEGILPDQ